MPWAADIRRIEERYSDLPTGLQIPAADIEACIHEPRTESRFNSVQAAWRRKLEAERGIIIKRRRGVFVVLDNSEKVDVASLGYRQGLRKIVVAGDRARGTGEQGLSQDKRRVRDHVAIMSGTLVCLAQAEAKKLDWPDPTVRKLVGG